MLAQRIYSYSSQQVCLKSMVMTDGEKTYSPKLQSRNKRKMNLVDLTQVLAPHIDATPDFGDFVHNK